MAETGQAQLQATNLDENVMNVLRRLQLVIGNRIILLDETPEGKQTVLYQELHHHLQTIEEVLRMGGRAMNDQDQNWLQEIIESIVDSN